MKEKLLKYTCEGARIHIVFLNDAVRQMQKAHALSEEDASRLGQAAAIAQCLTADRKEDNASVAVTLRFPDAGKNYVAIAEIDGRVRGMCENAERSVSGEVVLEVTQKLTVRGDYSSIVEGADTEDAIAQYYKTSQQVEARCAVLKFGDTYCCLSVEQFPITCEAEEIYRHAADREWEYLRPFITATELTDSSLDIFKKYRKVAETPLKFGCTCTRRSVRAALSAIDEEELKKIADGDGFVSVNCKYCGKHYRIDISED